MERGAWFHADFHVATTAPHSGRCALSGSPARSRTSWLYWCSSVSSRSFIRTVSMWGRRRTCRTQVPGGCSVLLRGTPGTGGNREWKRSLFCPRPLHLAKVVNKLQETLLYQQRVLLQVSEMTSSLLNYQGLQDLYARHPICWATPSSWWTRRTGMWPGTPAFWRGMRAPMPDISGRNRPPDASAPMASDTFSRRTCPSRPTLQAPVLL